MSVADDDTAVVITVSTCCHVANMLADGGVAGCDIVTYGPAVATGVDAVSLLSFIFV